LPPWPGSSITIGGGADGAAGGMGGSGNGAADNPAPLDESVPASDAALATAGNRMVAQTGPAWAKRRSTRRRPTGWTENIERPLTIQGAESELAH